VRLLGFLMLKLKTHPKSRYILHYKKLKYKVALIGYEDIELTAKSVGAAPTATKPDGITPRYTIPFIHDSDKNAVVSDSIRIAEYLDNEYPSTASALPNNTCVLQAAFAETVFETSRSLLGPYLGPRLRECMSQRLIEGQRKLYGTSLADVELTSEERVEAWKKGEAAFAKIGKYYPDGRLYVLGNTPSYGDFTIVGMWWYARELLGRESSEWKEFSRWLGGRIDKLVDAVDSLPSTQVEYA
jgi:glutathione S-transferase